MSTPADSSADDSLRYWKAAIATLPPQKRDAAWEFYVNKVGESRAGDTLSGLILLLEANGIFLQSLPADFDVRLVHPLEHLLSNLTADMQRYAHEQGRVRVSTEKTLEEIAKASRVIALCSSDVAVKVQTVVQNISAENIAIKICRSLETSTLDRMRSTMKNLDDGTAKLGQASQSARRSVELWRRVHVFGLFAWAGITAVILGLIMGWFAESRIRKHYQTRLAEEVTRLTNKASRAR